MVKKLVQMVPVLRAKIKTVTTCNLVRRKADTIDKIASFIYERIKKRTCTHDSYARELNDVRPMTSRNIFSESKYTLTFDKRNKNKRLFPMYFPGNERRLW